MKNQQFQYREDEIDLVDYIKVIYKHRKMIILLVLASMFFAGTFSLLKPKIYEAQATFFPMNVREHYGVLSQSEAFAMKRQLDIEDLIISILESRKMAEKIIEQTDLKKIWNKKLMVDTQRVLRGATKITLEKNGIIKLSARTESPELSAKIANAYVDNLDYFNRQLDIGAQRNMVQVIDRAVVPEKRMPRGLKKNLMVSALVSTVIAIFWAFFIDYINKSGVVRRLK